MQIKGTEGYPISPYLEEICNTLRTAQSHCLVLTAETAAGKSTVLPLALLQEFEGKIIMTEPRRLAVLGVANRLSEFSEEIGYKIHLESHITEQSRLEVMTEAILVRQLQEDPALENYNVVVLDEFHERSINTDLALAFLKEALQLRNDLFVIVMSATIDSTKLQTYLDCSVMAIPGRQFPVKKIYESEQSVEGAIYQAIRISQEGNILVFLPGISDIKKIYEKLKESGDFDQDSNFELCILHSSISLEEQKRVIAPLDQTKIKPKRRIILSSAIAETSLTVPGVTFVIDSGLARVNRLDLNTGMEKLTTEVESEFSAEQRSGRAGRLTPGTCIRLWAPTDPRVKSLPPEILRTDLVPLVLECSERGVYTAGGIDWLDAPSVAAWRTSCTLLETLGMLRPDKSGRITDRGRAALYLGIHPRLAGIALSSWEAGGQLGEQARRLLVKYSQYSRSTPELQRRFIADLEKRLKKHAQTSSPAKENAHNNQDTELLILEAYPDRLAHRLSAPGVEPAEYQFAAGRKALLFKQNAPEWLVAPDVLTNQKGVIIFEFEELSTPKITEFLEKKAEIRQICKFSQGKIQKTENKCFGEIILSSKKIPSSPQDLAQAWLTEIAEKGLSCLPLNEKTQSLLLRAEFILQQKAADTLGQVEKANIETNLLDILASNAKDWLLPFLSGATSLSPDILYDALYWYLDGAKIDSLAPEQIVLENGRRTRVHYESQAEIRPVIEIIIQRIFACFTTPEICGKKVLIRLLSPASRPLQVTDDLENFWTGAWLEICKEMKGRYPKHNWDYHIAEKL